MGSSKVLRIGMEHQGDAIIREALRGLGGIYVWISHIDAEAERQGLTRMHLKEEVERRLAAAGIPILRNQDQVSTPIFPCLGILVHVDQSSASPPHFLYSLEVFFVKTGNLMGNHSANSLQMVWCRETLGEVTASEGAQVDWSQIVDSMMGLVNHFIADYLAANPPSPGPVFLN